jgi:hypothetical protein
MGQVLRLVANDGFANENQQIIEPVPIAFEQLLDAYWRAVTKAVEKVSHSVVSTDESARRQL